MKFYDKSYTCYILCSPVSIVTPLFNLTIVVSFIITACFSKTKVFKKTHYIVLILSRHLCATMLVTQAYRRYHIKVTKTPTHEHKKYIYISFIHVACCIMQKYTSPTNMISNIYSIMTHNPTANDKKISHWWIYYELFLEFIETYINS